MRVDKERAEVDMERKDAEGMAMDITGMDEHRVNSLNRERMKLWRGRVKEGSLFASDGL